MSRIRKDTAKSWVVLIGVTFTVFFAFGVIKSLGVLLPQLTEQLDSDTWIIGSCVSLMMAWGYTVGISTQALVMKFGPCIVAVGCGILSSAGLVLCAFAQNIVVFFVGILLAGLIYDVTQSFTLSFAVLAVVSSLPVISLGLEELSSP